MKFAEFNLHPHVLRGIDDAAFDDCTPVQEKTLDKTLRGTDVYVQSQTGTGKTAAFLITIFHLFLTGDRYRNKKALIIVPTRELAVQVEKEAKQLGKHCRFKVGSFFGGIGYEKQEKLLKSDLNVYVGTPGRLIDFYKSGKLDLKAFDILVIDEADRMFDMGFIPDIRYMVKKMPPPAERLTMLYSATLSQRVKQLAWEYMNDPVEIEIQPEHVTVDTISQKLYHVARDEKFSLLLGLLRREEPKSLLIFTNTKKMAEIVSRRLAVNGFPNEYISGDLPQKKRLQIIENIKSGRTTLLVATDVAARGLHIEDLDMVVNYDLPDDCENYVHRIGRTARAGKSGKAISLACETFVFNLEAIEKFIGMKIPTEWEFDDLLARDIKDAGPPPRDTDRVRHDRDERGARNRGERKGRRDDRKERGDRRPAVTSDRKPAAAKKPPRDRQERPAAAEKRPNQERRPAQAAQGSPRRKQETQRNGNGRQRDKRDKRRAEDSRALPGRLPASATPEERLAYYRQKYGEDFMLGDSSTKKKAGGRGFGGAIRKLVGLFKIKA
ncbi:MAG TPA: DEAD/DEAH box helicase [Spirochaetota bacterium]|nr:DEAD/DEAH box helicase [Spirochaetota bacterium]HNU91518.1 DEAD/DEAH box helicase [Spirochaetota bacterium]HPI13555.1 DEAD/DEAH box helicase [Spirochaetota bacterium]HPO44406.1 DEAD/DEAH box helicase [Spirochaetota bacterium]